MEEPEEEPEIEMEEDKELLEKLESMNNKSLQHILFQISDILQLYEVVFNKCTMGITVSPPKYMLEILRILKNNGIIE